MKKISIRSSFFKLLQFLYYSFCLCGLIWQVVEISNNFFRFGVVTDIKIFMADTIKEDENLQICFFRTKLLNMTVYEQLWNKYHSSVPERAPIIPNWSFIDENLTLNEMFSLSLELDEVFSILVETKAKESYIHNNLICYELRGREFYLTFEPDSVHKSQVDFIFVQLDDAIPKSCRTNKHKVYNIKHGKWMVNTMSVNYYDMIKLPLPYPDDCFDYTSIGYIDQSTAVGKCLLDYAMIKQHITYSGYCYKKSEAKYLPYRMMDLDGDSCDSRFQRVDCKKKYYRMVSNSNVVVNSNQTTVVFETETGNDPSFLIESKPRIDYIDFITYICGAVGTWFGVCALNFNPFPIFFKPNELIRDNTNAMDHFLVTPSRVKRLEDRLAILSASFRLQLAATSSQVKELSRDVERLNTKDELVMSEIE